MIVRLLYVFAVISALLLSTTHHVHAKGDAASHVKRATVKIVIRDQGNRILGTGSGVIVSPQGYIITARHVVSEYYKAKTTTNVFVRKVDENLILGPENPVTVFDPDSDIDMALLRLTAIDLPFIKVGRSSTLPLDENLLAYGFPLGSVDVTSKPGRRSNAHWEVDNPISPGFSGGPVVKDGCDILIGIAQGGLETSPGALLPGRSLIVPIQYGATLLAKADVPYAPSLCDDGGPGPGPAPIPPDNPPHPAGCEEVTVSEIVNGVRIWSIKCL